MKKYLFVLSTLALFALSSCQKYAGDLITQDFTIEGNYTELKVEDSFEVTVSDTVDVITITAGENVMPKVIEEVVDNTLKIRIKPMANFYGGELKALIPFNANLTNVDLSGASDFHSEYGLEGQKVEVSLSGSSDFYGDILADKIDADLSGSSNIKGNVAANELDLDMSGASDATLEGQVGMLKINLSGDGNIHVSLSGSSELHYTGNAATTGCDCSGGSEISHDVL